MNPREIFRIRDGKVEHIWFEDGVLYEEDDSICRPTPEEKAYRDALAAGGAAADMARRYRELKERYESESAAASPPAQEPDF